MKKTRWIIIATLLLVGVATIVLFHSNDITDDSNKAIVDEQVDMFSEELTVTDVLQIRNELKQSYYEDSVFIHMPEDILTSILVEMGTNLSTSEIVNEYISNLDHYNKIKAEMDKKKNYIKSVED